MAIANNMKTKHTNGPWKWDQKSLNGSPWPMLKPLNANDGWIAMTADPNGPDARLMAAAPDLLTAVQQLVATLHSTYEVFEDLRKSGDSVGINPLDNHVVQDIADQAADALEQATGIRP